MFDDIAGEKISLDMLRLELKITSAIFTGNFSSIPPIAMKLADPEKNNLHYVRPLLELAEKLANRKLATTRNKNGACFVAMLAGAATPPDSGLRKEVEASIHRHVQSHPEVARGSITADGMYEALTVGYNLWRQQGTLYSDNSSCVPSLG